MKKLNVKLFSTLLVALFLVIMASFTATAFASGITGSNQNAVTEKVTLTSFQINEGAEVRQDSPKGIRFTSTISDADLALLPNTAEFGTLIIPKTLLTEDELLIDNATAQNIKAEQWWSANDGINTFTGCIVGESIDQDFPTTEYNTVLVARGYVSYTYGDNLTDVIYTGTTERSLAQTAAKGLVAGLTDQILYDIVDTVVTSIAFDVDAKTMAIGESFDVALTGTQGLDYKLEVTGDAVTIANGKITAVSEGTATLTATLGSRTATMEIQVKTAADLYGAKFTNYLEHKSVDDGTGIKAYVEANKPATTDYTEGAILTYDVYYDNSFWYQDINGHGCYDAANPLTDSHTFSWFCSYRVKWTVTNEYGSDFYWQHLPVKTGNRGSKELTISSDNTLVTGNATLDASTTLNGQPMFKVNGSANIVLGYDLSEMPDRYFNFIIINNSNSATTFSVNDRSKTLSANTSVIMDEMVANGNLDFRVGGIPNISITMDNGGELLIGYFAVSSSTNLVPVGAMTPAKFNSYLGNVVVPSGGIIKDYLEANKPAVGDYTDGATISYSVSYNNYTYHDAILSNDASFGPGEPTTQTFSTSWVYCVEWKVANQFGGETYNQWIYVLNGLTHMPTEEQNIELTGSAEYVSDKTIEGENMIKVTGTATITVTCDLTDMAANSLRFVIFNNTSDSYTVKFNGYSRQLNANNGVVMNQMEAAGNNVEYITDGKITLTITFEAPEGVTPEIYIGYFCKTVA